MKKLTKVFSLIMCICLVLSFSACSSGEKVEGFVLYYVGTEDYGLTQVSYSPKTDLSDTAGMIKELLGVLQTSVGNAKNCTAPISTAFELMDCKLEKDILTLNFSQGYLKLERYEEIAIRAAIVKTLAQVKGVTSIFFTVNGQPLADANNTAVGGMTGESFVDISGKSLSNPQQTKVKLYFACDDGSKLSAVETTVDYLNTTSLAKVVVEKLVQGPDNSDLTPILPKDTKILSVSVKEGVCYINFDKTFLQGTSMVDPEVTIYGIVNTLSELSSVNKVQFSIESDSNIKFMENISLNQVFSRNLDLVKVV